MNNFFKKRKEKHEEKKKIRKRKQQKRKEKKGKRNCPLMNPEFSMSYVLGALKLNWYVKTRWKKIREEM